jgi:hypothetical protein
VFTKCGRHLLNWTSSNSVSCVVNENSKYVFILLFIMIFSFLHVHYFSILYMRKQILIKCIFMLLNIPTGEI